MQLNCVIPVGKFNGKCNPVKKNNYKFKINLKCCKRVTERQLSELKGKLI
jgi:hypothetical protein